MKLRAAPAVYNRRVGGRVVALLVLACGSAQAEPADPDERARALYQKGKEGFDHGRFLEAQASFKAAYLISQRPELLFDMAAALEGCERPHEAAESLRAYLRVRPGDADRARIEEHVRALDEKQRLIDAERAATVPHLALRAPPPAPPQRRTPLHKRWWLWTAVALVVVAGAAVGVGVGLTRQTTYPSSPGPSDGTFRF